jgi:hypothetical protein
MKSNETRMRLQYGVNEADSWWHFAVGPGRERIWARLRQLRPRIVRIFLFDKHAPDPVREWNTLESYVQAVLNLGATPMITFAKFPRPADDPRAIRWFAERCGDVVWGSMERWGAEAVSNWYWCVWNEPNSTWIGGGLTFDQYRRVYEAVAEAIVRWLGPHLRGRRPNIGGPAVEGFAPFWMDWVWRFVNEIDPSLIGFVNWHRYTEWREEGEAGAPLDAAALRALILAQTPEYLDRAEAVARLVNGSGVLNICGEWNAHSHYLPKVRARFNQSVFGAAYGASVLLQLMRGGADAEMLWTGTDVECGYGVLDGDGEPTPLFHAKALCAQSIRYGDWISFPDLERHPELDAVVARGEDGRRSVFLVHLADGAASYELSELAGDCGDLRRLLKIDCSSGGSVIQTVADSVIRFDGYGVAALTNAPEHLEGAGFSSA